MKVQFFFPVPYQHYPDNMFSDPNDFDSDDEAILEMFGVRRNVDGRAVLTQVRFLKNVVKLL